MTDTDRALSDDEIAVLRSFFANSQHADADLALRLLSERDRLAGEVERLRAQHDPGCDALEPGPQLGPSTKPCNCWCASLARAEALLSEAVKRNRGEACTMTREEFCERADALLGGGQ